MVTGKSETLLLPDEATLDSPAERVESSLKVPRKTEN